MNDEWAVDLHCQGIRCSKYMYSLNLIDQNDLVQLLSWMCMVFHVNTALIDVGIILQENNGG